MISSCLNVLAYQWIPLSEIRTAFSEEMLKPSVHHVYRVGEACAKKSNGGRFERGISKMKKWVHLLKTKNPLNEG